MKNHKQHIICFLCIILLWSIPLTLFAHSGRTDSSGGHHDYKNKSGLGSYHYHHGMEAHLHPNGICPYSGEDSSGSQTESYVPPSTSISIKSCPETLNVGESSGVEYSVSNATNDESSITSSDSSIVKVNPDGTLTGVNAGTAQVTVSASGATESFTVNVKTVPVESIDIPNKLDKIQLGDMYQLEPSVLPENATDKAITWTSDNEDILRVSEEGNIVAKGVGDSTITATAVNGIETKIPIEVYEILPQEIECQDSLEIIVGDEKDFQISILPENANDKSFEIFCNDKILDCSDSMVKAVSEGKTTLHIKTWNGIEKSIPVEINIIPVGEVEIKDTTDYMLSNVIDKRGKISILAEILPKDATYQDIEWVSSDKDIIDIEDGRFNIKGTGKVKLTCTAYGGISSSIDLVIVDTNMIIMVFLLSGGGIAVIAFILKRKHSIWFLHRQ